MSSLAETPTLPHVPLYLKPAPAPQAEIDKQYAEAVKAVQDRSISGYFDFEGDRGNYFTLATRDGGDVGEETPGEGDLKCGRAIAQKLRAKFPLLKIHSGPVDEWVSVGVHREKRPAPAAPPLTDEFCEKLLNYCAAVLKNAGFTFVEEPRLTKSEHMFLPIVPHWTLLPGNQADNATMLRAVAVLTPALVGEGYGTVGFSYIQVGERLIAMKLEGLPR